jgi:hypothetical protein
MSWWDIIKDHPRLVELLGKKSQVLVKFKDEKEVIELWNASNPTLQMQTRDSRGLGYYPIDTWYGVIKKVNGKPILGAIGGYAIRQGKGGKKFAFIGGIRGNRTREFKGIPTNVVREKYLGDLKGIPKIAGYTDMGAIRFATGEQPAEHEVIPDEVLNSFRNDERYKDWRITKQLDWFVWE